MNFTIAAMKEDDWAAVLEIYRQGIATGNATFETDLPSWQKWDAGHLRHCRIVARDGPAVLRWAALSPVSTRRVYEGVMEVSIYICRRSARPRHWPSFAARIDSAIGVERHLDAAGGNLS